MMTNMIRAASIADRLAGLDGVGVGPGGEVHRLAWTEEDAACRAWFEQQAAAGGLTVERDPAGNIWARPEQDPPWWGIGSHLDSVRGGGRFDGPLGVACGFEIARAVSAPVAVLSFADEEGARFNTPTFGSKALTGRLDLPAVLDRRDDAGIPLGEAMRAAGVDPQGVVRAPEWTARLARFVEVHIDQTTELAGGGEPVGIVRSLASRRRLGAHLTGRADHAGTTPRSERRDALAAAARLIVAAEDLAEPDPSLTVTTSRILARPNAPTTIASDVRLWIDARSSAIPAIGAWQRRLEEFAGELTARTRVEIELRVASRSESQEFASQVRADLARAAELVLGHAAPELVCFAGHDAGVLAERVPAAMVFVRNPTGVSHSPEETIDLEDAAIAARVVERALTAATAGAR
jgi:beta-ureidopropionase / N-carbamoyl-L-amino-acid hydrolase